MDGTLAGAWVTLSLALSFFIFFAKRLPFIILCTTCGTEIMQFERFFDCSNKLKLFFYFFLGKKIVRIDEDFVICLMCKVKNLPTQVIIWKTFAKVFYQIKKGKTNENISYKRREADKIILLIKKKKHEK